MSVYRVTLYLSLVVCLTGILYRLVRGGLRWIDPAPDSGPTRPKPAAFPSRFQYMVVEVLFQTHVFKQDRYRWGMHQCLLWGVTLLILMHALDDVVSVRLFADYAPTMHPFRFLRNLFGGLALLGILMAAGRRMVIRNLRRTTRSGDWLVLLLLGFILLTGFFLESAMILSPAVFDEMTAEYLGSDAPEDIRALRAFWARDFGVAFFDKEVSAEPGVIEAGRELHGETCAMCHTRPSEAFVSWPLARALRSGAARLEGWILGATAGSLGP